MTALPDEPVRALRAVPDDIEDAELVDITPHADDLIDALTPADRTWLTQHGWRGTVATVADRHHLPTPRQAVASLGWWAKLAAKIVAWSPLLLLAELRPIWRGITRTTAGLHRWTTCADYAAAVKEAKGEDKHKAQEKLETRKAARVKVVAVGLLLVAVAATWVVLAYPIAATAAFLVLAAVFDMAGRHGLDTPTTHIVLPRGPIGEGMSLSSLRTELVDSLEAQGVEAEVAMPHPVEHGWTVDYHSRQAVEDDHLRQLERDLNIRRGGITQIVQCGQAARGELQIMLKDPLARVVDSPDPGPLSIYQPLPLGVTASGVEWVENFLRTHFSLAGQSQSGKSSCLWQITDVLRRCPEQELDCIDLTEGPAFGATRRAFRRRGFDEESAMRILTEAVALCKERNAELNRLAEADDTPDDYEEKWQPTPEHPQRTILIDEFARVAENPELLKLVEYVLRYGAKAAVTIGIAGQGATLQDYGTSVVRAQIMLKILFACSRADVLYLFGKDARDAGYRPDLFEPANGAGIQDAGKAYAMSALSRTAEARRAYRLEQSEVRRRDRELGARTRQAASVDVVEVPQILLDFQAAFAARGNPEHLPTADLIADRGWTCTPRALAASVKEYQLVPAQHPVSKARGYYREHLERALGDL
jgi:hypothetical protein